MTNHIACAVRVTVRNNIAIQVLFSVLITCSVGCASAPERRARRPSDAPEEAHTSAAYDRAFSEVLEVTNPPSEEAAEFLRITFDMAYKSGIADALPAQYSFLAGNAELACTSTVARLIHGSSTPRVESLGHYAVTECPKWTGAVEKDVPMPGPSYGRSRRIVLQKVVGFSNGTRGSALSAFEAGYKAGLDDTAKPSRKDLSRIVVKSCTAVTRVFPPEGPETAETICAAVATEIAP
jgi:hypothetical protein